MNYLAHLLLADGDEYRQVGSLLGDFVKGPISRHQDSAYIEGIIHHRKVDQFTDDYYCQTRISQIFTPGRRRYAGIILDISFDHFLSVNWESFSDEELAGFSSKTYSLLDKHVHAFPERLKDMYPYIRNESWLTQYSGLDGVRKSIDRVSRYKIRGDNPLFGATAEVEAHYEFLNSYFLEFFPHLVELSDSMDPNRA